MKIKSFWFFIIFVGFLVAVILLFNEYTSSKDLSKMRLEIYSPKELPVAAYKFNPSLLDIKNALNYDYGFHLDDKEKFYLKMKARDIFCFVFTSFVSQNGFYPRQGEIPKEFIEERLKIYKDISPEKRDEINKIYNQTIEEIKTKFSK